MNRLMADVQGYGGMTRIGACLRVFTSHPMQQRLTWRSLRAMVAVACVVCAVAPEIL